MDFWVGGSLVTLSKVFARPRKFAFKKGVRVLLIKYLSIGDSILTLPLLKALADAGAHVDVLTHESNAKVFTGHSFIKNVRLLGSTFKKSYDIAIDAEPWSFVSALLARRLGKRTMGFAYQYRSTLYDGAVVYDKNQHVVETYLDFARLLGVAVPENPQLIPLAVSKHDKKEVDSLNLPKQYAALAIGIGPTGRYRLWPAQRWAHLIARMTIPVVIVGAPADRDDVDEVTALLTAQQRLNVIDLCAQTSMLQSAEVMRRASVFVGCDSGPMHMAAAMGTSTVGLFGPNTPVLWGPHGKRTVALFHKNPGVPCIINDDRKFYDDRGKGKQAMNAITVDEVVAAIRQISR